MYLQDLLDQLERSPSGEYTYTQILLEEEMFARLLEHVRKAPYRETFTVTQKLLTKFPRRPALREELGKIRF